MSDIINAEHGQRLPAMGPLDPEHGLDAIRRTVSYDGPPGPPPPPAPLRTRTLATLRQIAEQDTGEVDVAALLRIVALLVNRVL